MSNKATKAPVKKAKSTGNRKAIAAVTLVVALLLTAVFAYVGVFGFNMDQSGLHKLLPWLPTPGQRTSWRQALVPGTELGETVVQTYALTAQDGEVSAEALEQAAKITTKRLWELGWRDAVVEPQGQDQLKVVMPAVVGNSPMESILGVKGEFTLRDSEGKDFVTGDVFKNASFHHADNSGTNLVLTFEVVGEGQNAIKEQLKKGENQTVTLTRDGTSLGSLLLREGNLQVSGLNINDANLAGVLIRSGALQHGMTLANTTDNNQPLLGVDVQKTLIFALYAVCLLIGLYFIARFRLGGLIAAWMLFIQLALTYFMAALINAGYSVQTLLAIHLSFLVTVFAMVNLFSSVQEDILRGRSVRVSLKESYAGRGHASLDVYTALILIGVIMIIMEVGVVKSFFEVFSLGLLIGLLVTHVLLRIIVNEAVILFSDRRSLYTAVKTVRKEA